MKDLTFPENFKVTLSRETFDIIKESARNNNIGVYRSIKNYLTLHLFPYMLRGDSVRIIYLDETFTSVGVMLNLNLRLLTKAQEKEGSAGLYDATRQRGKNPLGGTEPTAAD